MNLLEEISSTLEAAGIRHALIGALALSAYGVNRASVDPDLFAASPSGRPSHSPGCEPWENGHPTPILSPAKGDMTLSQTRGDRPEVMPPLAGL
jgi:hypothetical protein